MPEELANAEPPGPAQLAVSDALRWQKGGMIGFGDGAF